jgi:hypothetical protein
LGLGVHYCQTNPKDPKGTVDVCNEWLQCDDTRVSVRAFLHDLLRYVRSCVTA